MVKILACLVLITHLTFSQSRNKADEIFKEAYEAFEDKDFNQAIERFQAHILIDTLMYDYESYAFLAESFKQSGLTDSGLAILTAAVAKVEQRLSSQDTNKKSLKHKILTEWKAQYPSFPENLTKEKGFVPYDEQPVPVEQVRPSDEGLKKGYEGSCMLKGLLDESGNVIDVTVLQSTEDFPLKRTVEAFYKWKFTPHKRKGKPERTFVAIPFRFKIGK